MKRQILAGLLVLFAISGIAAAAERNVPGSYGTIQAAIDAAVSGDDEVVVADGTYTGVGNRDIDFNGKAITVRSANGPENCIIDCNGLARGFYFHTSETSASVVDGFTITNGYNANYGGAIECDGASPTISNCIITGNSSYDGGGIDCYDGSPTIIDCVITDNDADGVGGAIECYDATPSIINCLIKNNYSVYNGDGINCENSSAIVRNCTIVDNGDGIYADSLSSPIITNSIFWDNGDDLAGFATATYCCIEDNDAGTGNIHDDPMFREGPLSPLVGNYYLSQISAGQLIDSNCVNAGNNTAAALGMNVYTTCTNNVIDGGVVDIGYHYASGSVTQYSLTTSVIDPNYGSISPDPNMYDEFTDVVLIAEPNTGFKLKEWTGTNDDSSHELNNVVTIDANKAVSVEFEAKTMYQLTTVVDDNEGGSISPPNSPQYEGDTILLTALADAGYQVKSWTGTNDDNSVDPNNYVTMDSDKTVTVDFVSSIVSLTVQVVDGNGTVAPKRGNYAVGTVVNLTATPDPNYRVEQWTGTDYDLSTEPNNTVTMTDHNTVSVEFQPIPLYNLTATVIGGNGTVAPGSGSFYDGTVVNLTATPDPGYRVKQWTGTDDDSSTETNNTVTMTDNKTVFVEFELILYNLTVTVVDVGYGPCGTVDPNGSSHFYYDGMVVSLTATPDPNYEIKAWTGTDYNLSTEPNNTVT
ncbi:MAG: hypothetical protein KAI59_04410, partial [Planctomycetes bacterium]|nr:hypothetical protein [Planctomycetota bacterium]